MPLGRIARIVSWVAQIAAAVILFQTLFFKFTGAAESVYIFTTLGAEPWGRIGSGIVELVASICLVVPSTAAIGGVLALGTACGALMAHLTRLGIAIPETGDTGELFALAVTVLVCGVTVVWLRRRELPLVGNLFAADQVGAQV